MANSPLVNVTVKADPSNYTAGRGGFKINHITIHHMAGVLTAAQCGAIFARKGRGGSANYGVGSDGKVGLYVNESDRAWADSNWNSNCTTVSIETSNSSTGGNWPVSALTFDKLVLLVADIAKRNGLGKLVPGKNLTWHSMYAATACPGDYLRSKMQELADRANAINYPPAPTVELIWTKCDRVEKYICNKQPTTLWNFNSATWAGCKAVKDFNKGDEIDIYGQVQNKNLNAIYLLTEYSYTKGVTNGFNKVDLDLKKEPEPTPEPEPEPEPTPEPTPEDPTVGILERIIKFIQHIIELITEKK